MSAWNKTPQGKAYQQKYWRQYTDKFKKIVFEYYGNVCACCGETLSSMLTIDHVNNDGYKDRQAQISGAAMYRKIINQGLPDTYQILCMNCNWSKRILKGICQHQIKE